MFFVYILKSKRNGRYYIGSASHLENRLQRHNAGRIKSTKRWIPFEIAYAENYLTNSEARKREFYIKRRKSRKYIESLIKLQNEKIGA